MNLSHISTNLGRNYYATKMESLAETLCNVGNFFDYLRSVLAILL
jgi:hypothetical protein